MRNGLVSGLPEEHRATALDEIAHVDARTASRTLRTAAGFELEQLPPMPTLVLCGDRDRVNVKLSQRLAETLPKIDTVLVPWGGGGLSCGIATALRALAPAAKVIGCEAETATPLTTSLAAGKPMTVT